MAKEKYQNALLQSMSIIADQSVKKAGYDTTIQATIMKCVDPTIEQYQIKYQGAYWYAYGNGAGVKYPDGCNVYILVPKGDMSQLKTILGTVQKLGINYVNPIAEENKYEETGGNVISQNTNEFGLCSYKKKDTLLLYENGGTGNKISINNSNLKYYFQTATHLCCSFDIRTNLNAEQKYQGKYGIKFIVEEKKTNNKNETIEKTYIIDTDSFTGNPYNFQNKINQKIFIEFDITNFVQVKEVSLFAEGFPVQNNTTTTDIFFSNLSFKGMKMLTQEEMDGISLSFVARKGYIFESSGTSQLPIEAVVRAAGKTVNNSIQVLKYYWFVKNAYITASNVWYCKEGGKGWKCLNNYKVLSGTKAKPTKIEYNSGKPILTIKKSDVSVKQVKYKCVVIYGNESFSKQFTIKNNNAKYTITITSDKGTQFNSGLGTPTLTCKISPVPEGIIHYHWTITDQTGISIEGNSTSNKITYDVQKIIGFNRFTCTITDNNYNLIGSGQITLVNKKTSDGGYILNITNGQQVFNYNEQGVSPCKNKLINFVIPQLGFTLIDKTGKSIDVGTIDKNNITWAITGSSGIINTLKVSSDKLTATYAISDYFKSNVRNDNIRLTIIYAGYTIVANTRFTFTKQGFSGTNGTGMVARIVVNYNNNVIDNNYIPILYKDADENSKTTDFTKTNFNSVTAELWRNGEQIQQKENWSCVWSILKNSNETTYIKILSPKSPTTGIRRTNSKTGTIIPISSYGSDFSNILQVTITYGGKRYYATMPVITADQNGNYIIYLKENTGFEEVVYLDDGTYPNYSNRAFSFIVKDKKNDIDVTSSSDFRYVSNGPVTDQTSITQSNRTYKPSTTFSGSNTAKYLRCRATYNGKNVHMNIPIYHHLNLYGHAALNEWNGNSIQFLDDKGKESTILTPQIGAGSKNTENKFTGLLMGTVQNDGTTKTGLFGYSEGAQSIFLDSSNGNATFGVQGTGQIIMKPNSGTITGGEYSTKKGTGMQIDLETPSIDFGSGNFSVTKEGKMTAKGGGSIAGWAISDTSLTKGKVGLSSDYYKRNASGKIIVENGKNQVDYTKKAIWAGKISTAEPEDAPFNVDFNGNVKMTSASIGGSNENQILIKTGRIYSSKHDGLTSKEDGFYLSKSGLSIGSNFSVNTEGKIIARKGYIGNGASGFTIDSNKIYNGKASLTDAVEGVYIGTNGISLGKGNTFSVTKAGLINAVSGRVGGWNISSAGIYNDAAKNAKQTTYSHKVKENGKEVTKVCTTGVFLGPAGLRLGKNFHVNSAGNLYAINGYFGGTLESGAGHIGGWSITKSALTSENKYIVLNSAQGTIKGRYWEIASYYDTNKKLHSHFILGSEQNGIILNAATKTMYSAVGKDKKWEITPSKFVLSADSNNEEDKTILNAGTGSFTSKYWSLTKDMFTLGRNTNYKISMKTNDTQYGPYIRSTTEKGKETITNWYLNKDQFYLGNLDTGKITLSTTTGSIQNNINEIVTNKNGKKETKSILKWKLSPEGLSIGTNIKIDAKENTISSSNWKITPTDFQLGMNKTAAIKLDATKGEIIGQVRENTKNSWKEIWRLDKTRLVLGKEGTDVISLNASTGNIASKKGDTINWTLTPTKFQLGNTNRGQITMDASNGTVDSQIIDTKSSQRKPFSSWNLSPYTFRIGPSTVQKGIRGKIEIKSDGSIKGYGCDDNGKVTWSINEKGEATFNKITIKNGKWDGGDITGGTISNTRTGGAVTGGDRTGGGFTGGSIAPSAVKVGNQTLQQWTQDIVTNSIKTGELSVGGHTAKWQEVRTPYQAYLDKHSTTITTADGKSVEVLNSLTNFVIHWKRLYSLCAVYND